MIGAYNSGKRINVHSNLSLNDNPDLENLQIFENSYQESTYSWFYKGNPHYNHVQLQHTAVTNTEPSIGVMKNWFACQQLTLSNNNLQSLSALFPAAGMKYSRTDYYDNYTFWYLHVTRCKMNTLDWMLSPVFSGVYYLTMDYNPDITYEKIAKVASSLINLKTSGQIRLGYWNLNASGWDLDLADGTIPKCENGQMSKFTQIKKNLYDAGIRIHLGVSGMSWTTFPTC